MQSQYLSYKDFGVAEFLLDDDFLDWVKLPTAERDIFWEQFLQEYPGKNEDLEEARTIASHLNFKKDLPASGSEERVWKQILESSRKSPVVSFTKNLWWAAAAVLILVAGSTWLLNRQDMVAVQTTLGQIENVVLPDGSRVVL